MRNRCDVPSGKGRLNSIPLVSSGPAFSSAAELSKALRAPLSTWRVRYFRGMISRRWATRVAVKRLATFCSDTSAQILAGSPALARDTGGPCANRAPQYKKTAETAAARANVIKGDGEGG